MGKFFIACPKCGTLNPASTSFFSKKTIVCANCNEDIDVKASRNIARRCPHCNNTYVIDQSKTSKCPGCGRPYGNLVKLVCPSCSCQVEVSNDVEKDTCPVCNADIFVRRELERAKQVHANTISVIKYEGDNDAFIYKHPIEDFNLGTQLLVHESQEAIFFYSGEAISPFRAGRYTLSTENIPMLRNVTDSSTSGATPFHAEVYFTNLTDHVGLPWGTSERIIFIEPHYNIPLELRAFGTIGLRVVDSLKLIKKLIGTTSSLSTSAIFDGREDGTELPGFFKSPLLTEIKSYLPTVINQYGLNILNLDAHLKELSAGMLVQIRYLFEKYGLEVTEFNINRVSIPQDPDPNNIYSQNYKRLLKLQSERGLATEEMQFKASIAQTQANLDAQVLGAELNKVQAQGRINEAEASINANMARINAQGEADANALKIRSKGFADADVDRAKGMTEADVNRAKGMNDAEVMQAKGITEKDYVNADVDKAQWDAFGKMGSNVNLSGGTGGGSSITGEVVGLAAGLKVADYTLGKMENLNLFGNNNNTVPSAGLNAAWDCSCGKTGNLKNFCGACGKPRFSPNTWTCPACGCIGNTENFCENCGKPRN